jgi:hypothetical protein
MVAAFHWVPSISKRKEGHPHGIERERLYDCVVVAIDGTLLDVRALRGILPLDRT